MKPLTKYPQKHIEAVKAILKENDDITLEHAPWPKIESALDAAAAPKYTRDIALSLKLETICAIAGNFEGLRMLEEHRKDVEFLGYIHAGLPSNNYYVFSEVVPELDRMRKKKYPMIFMLNENGDLDCRRVGDDIVFGYNPLEQVRQLRKCLKKTKMGLQLVKYVFWNPYKPIYRIIPLIKKNRKKAKYHKQKEAIMYFMEEKGKELNKLTEPAGFKYYTEADKKDLVKLLSDKVNTEYIYGILEFTCGMNALSPTDSYVCPWCLIHFNKPGDCYKKCTYGKRHGICKRESDDIEFKTTNHYNQLTSRILKNKSIVNYLGEAYFLTLWQKAKQEAERKWQK